MNALILRGNSQHNKEWVQQIKTTLAPLFETVATHDYAHWASGGATIELPGDTHEYLDFAKLYELTRNFTR